MLSFIVWQFIDAVEKREYFVRFSALNGRTIRGLSPKAHRLVAWWALGLEFQGHTAHFAVIGGLFAHRRTSFFKF
jgi:hypothetical protein